MTNFFSSFSLFILLPFIVCLLLCYAVITDINFRKIPNWICLQVGLCFIAYFILKQDLALAGDGFLAAAVAFALMFPLFALKLMGGGDVKLITVVSLWVGTDQFIHFISLTAVIGGIIAVFYLIRFYLADCLLFIPVVGTKLSETITRGPQSIPYAIAIVCSAQYLLVPLIRETV